MSAPCASPRIVMAPATDVLVRFVTVTGPAAVTLVEMAAAAQATAGQRVPEHEAATPDSCRAAEQLLFHSLHLAEAQQVQESSQNGQGGENGAFAASTLSAPCTSGQEGFVLLHRALDPVVPVTVPSSVVHADCCVRLA